MKALFLCCIISMVFSLQADVAYWDDDFLELIEESEITYQDDSTSLTDNAYDNSGVDKENPSAKKTHSSDKVSRVYIGGYGGYGVINGMHSMDGQYAQFRFALGVDAYRWKTLCVGLEGAIQSGNTMRVSISTALLDETGGLLPQAVLKPFIDLLAVVRWNFVSKFHLLLKGGIAYRELQFTDRNSSQDSLRRINGEFQGGFGYQLNKHTRLVGLYQGIYSESSLGLTLSSSGDVLMHHIPMQQAGLLGIEYSF